MLKKAGYVWVMGVAMVTIAAITVAGNASAQTVVRQMEGVTEYRLANGLQVLLAPNDLQPRVYANLIIKAGSAVEGLGEGGMAHLLEHMVFKGTPTTKDPMREFNERSFSSNGTTTQDRTNYYASMNANQENLHWYIGWLADAMSNSFIAKADLDKEMTVVRNEFERAGSSVSRGMWDARMALTFPNHGYGRSVLGNRTDVENVPIDRLQAFYKTWYRPDNAVLVVAGRFNVAATLAHIQQVFGSIPVPQTPMPKQYTREPVQDGPRGATIRRVGGEPQTMISWRGVPTAHPDDAALDIVAHALANGAGGRFRDAVMRQTLGTSPVAYHSSMAQYGLFTVSVQPANADQLDTIRNVLQKHINDIAQTGVTAQELERAQSHYGVAAQEALNTAEGMGSSLASAVASGDWRLLYWSRDNLAKVTVADSQRVAAAYLIPANQVRVSYIPDAEAKRAPDANAQALADYVAQPAKPAANAPVFAELPKFEATAAEMDKRTVKSQLPNGTQVALLARPAVGDALQGTVRLYWGNLADYTEFGSRVRVAAMAGELLTRGTAKRDQKQLTDELNRLQSGVNVYSGMGGLTINFKTTRQHWPAFSILLTEMLREPVFMSPTFPSRIFETWKREKIANINANRDSGESLAQSAVARALSPYPATDPRYVVSIDESLAAWNALTLDQVKQFWTLFSGANVSQFAAAGALDVDAVQRGIVPLFDNWTASKPYQRVPYPLPRWTPQASTIATPDKTNAALLSRRYLSLKPYTREALAVQVANGLIGGTSASRLFTQLRKVEGLTYGTYSGTSQNDEDEVLSFGITGTFAPQNRARFEEVLNETKQDIIKNGLTRIELFAAKKVALERTKTNRENDVSTAGTLAFNAYKKLDFGFWQKQADLLQDLTIEELDQAAKRLLDANDFVTVVTGDFGKK